MLYVLNKYIFVYQVKFTLPKFVKIDVLDPTLPLFAIKIWGKSWIEEEQIPNKKEATQSHLVKRSLSPLSAFVKEQTYGVVKCKLMVY
ncbi:hypothetical protein D5018_06860 [Parashewanella curva]|uniref:Uncharacterized protein n=1 Tax=Parashewanella curva TaxID=2338552 RepID=A0A3L8PYI0_9GAMM|nr:hypothetical protein [Parashewanella curva]RLV60507.1 hypothetical protein D5018_06860 [Parashewanella curva]